jgi:hypothetical protein
MQVEAGVDPKSMFCQFFKQGLCKKGDKCKFSHDPDVERKAVKRNVYEEKVIQFIFNVYEMKTSFMYGQKNCTIFVTDGGRK